MPGEESLYEKLLSEIDQLEVIDTHEHLPREENRPAKADVLEEWLTHYFSCDLVSAGMSDEALAQVKDSSGDLMQRWDLVEPYWQAARTTGYGRSLELSAKGLYGIDAISRETIGPLNEAFSQARQGGGHYQYVLKDKSRIALSLVDMDLGCDRRFFASVANVRPLVVPDGWAEMEHHAHRLGLAAHSFEDYEELLRRWLDHVLEQGAVALKSALAYERTLRFEKVSRAAAEKDFVAFATPHARFRGANAWPGKAMQDYAMHTLLRLADQRGLTFQFHTGLQEGNGNFIAHSNPVHLTNLLKEYGQVKFDLFHMGYPYVMELGNLAKNFRNAYIDMCWGHIISPEAARRALVEWLDAVPANKISAFGGDYCFIDGVYGHCRLARQDVAASLARKVADGSFDLDRARQIARWVFVDNPVRLFNLADRLEESC